MEGHLHRQIIMSAAALPLADPPTRLTIPVIRHHPSSAWAVAELAGQAHLFSHPSRPHHGELDPGRASSTA